jgi:hypothetical protein
MRVALPLLVVAILIVTVAVLVRHPNDPVILIFSTCVVIAVLARMWFALSSHAGKSGAT